MAKSCSACAEKESHNHGKKRFDWFFWGSAGIVGGAYVMHLFFSDTISAIAYLSHFSLSSYELLNKMAWGLALGIIFIGILEKVPRDFVRAILGKGGTVGGILRATGAGVLLDLCSHGVLMVGMKLYERGASLGQVMAFLIASPWNSISLTLILWALIGFKLMMAFLLLSMLIAVVSGIIFEMLVKKGVLPRNPYQQDLPKNFQFWKEVRKQLKVVSWSPLIIFQILWEGMKGSKMILRWILFGVVLASAIRTFVSVEQFQDYFGPTLIGLGLTMVAATILEICSEGSTPIAADLVTRGGAAGNGFAFLMGGVSTDYTEIVLLKQTTKSWKIAFFLPLVTLPQVLILAWILNS